MKRKEVKSELLDRKPPCDDTAEKAVIGSLMLDPTKRSAIAGIVQEEDFHLPGCRLFFAQLMDMESLDSILLLDAMRRSGRLEKAGGAAFLTECIQSVAVAAHAEHYARIVRETARKRRLIRLLLNALQALYADKWDVEKLIQRLIQRLQDI